MNNFFGIAVIVLFSGGTIQQAYLHNWKLAGIYFCSAILNWLFLL
jgi:hypothetical protein